MHRSGLHRSGSLSIGCERASVTTVPPYRFDRSACQPSGRSSSAPVSATTSGRMGARLLQQGSPAVPGIGRVGDDQVDHQLINGGRAPCRW